MPTRTVETKFFQFSQNNSGGVFAGPKYKIIEATNSSEANSLAEDKYDIYFDGCEKGYDCNCCGDRWYRTYDEEGTDIPTVYGEKVNYQVITNEQYIENKFEKVAKVAIFFYDGSIGVEYDANKN